MVPGASNNIPPSLRKVWEDQEKYGRSYVPSRMMPTTTKAIVSFGSLKDDGWKMSEVTLRPLEAGELLVEMVAAGVCHTDALIGSLPNSAELAFYPRILGHEGSGYVREVGPGVTVARVGDPILLSYDFCGKCEICKAGHYSNCNLSNDLNFGPHHGIFHLASAGTDAQGSSVGGHFFGQSSFANYSIVKQASVVNVSGLIKDKAELQLFAPLGCGIQTGSGTVINVAAAGPKDVICIMGLGGVGLAAVMAAKISGCRAVIGIDRVESRLQLAKDLGATHVVDGSTLPEGKSLGDVVKEIADGVGPTITIDTTGAPVLIEAGFKFTRNRGKYIQVGTPPFDFSLSGIGAFELMSSGKQFIGAIEGGAFPPEYVPKMIQWYKDGKFPVDKLMKFLPAENFQQALKEMHDGTSIKPIITW